jgi:hypothetical protein
MTIATLGEGTLFTGVARDSDSDNPVGIVFSNQLGTNPNPEETIVLQITSMSAVASYTMAITYLIDAWNEGESSELVSEIKSFQDFLKPFMPIANLKVEVAV